MMPQGVLHLYFFVFLQLLACKNTNKIPKKENYHIKMV